MYLSSMILTSHRGQTGSEGLSPRIWDRFKRTLQSPDAGRSPFFHLEDFGNFAEVAPAISGSTTGASGGFATFQSTATTTSTIKQTSNENGAIELLAGATAHHQVTVQAGGTAGATFMVAASRAGGVRGFEARVRVPTGSASAAQGAFVGVAAAGNAATNFLVNTTMAVKDTNLAGFHFPIGATNVIRPVCRKSGVAVVDTIGVVKTYTAGTWVKLGFLYDPQADSAEALTFYVDNVRVGYMSQTEVDASFPVGIFMSPILSVKSLDTTGAKLECDWIGSFKA
jgi:hypothetical protein